MNGGASQASGHRHRHRGRIINKHLHHQTDETDLEEADAYVFLSSKDTSSIASSEDSMSVKSGPPQQPLDTNWLQMDTKKVNSRAIGDWLCFESCPYQDYCKYDDKRKKQMSRGRGDDISTQTGFSDDECERDADPLLVDHQVPLGSNVSMKENKGAQQQANEVMSCHDSGLESEVALMRNSIDELRKSNELLVAEVASLKNVVQQLLPKQWLPMDAENELIPVSESSFSDDAEIDFGEEAAGRKRTDDGVDMLDKWLSKAAIVNHELEQAENERIQRIQSNLGFNYTPDVDMYKWIRNYSAPSV